MKRLLPVAVILSLALTGCVGAAQHRAAVRDDTADKVSVAAVQREIRVGMSGADVVAVLGSPNMITTDLERRETWVYDKIVTERVYSTSNGGLGLMLGGLIGGSDGGAAGGLGSSGSYGAGAMSTSQRTLTIIIKFDHANRVRDFSYRQSSF